MSPTNPNRSNAQAPGIALPPGAADRQMQLMQYRSMVASVAVPVLQELVALDSGVSRDELIAEAIDFGREFHRQISAITTLPEEDEANRLDPEA